MLNPLFLSAFVMADLVQAEAQALNQPMENICFSTHDTVSAKLGSSVMAI